MLVDVCMCRNISRLQTTTIIINTLCYDYQNRNLLISKINKKYGIKKGDTISCYVCVKYHLNKTATLRANCEDVSSTGQDIFDIGQFVTDQ